MEQRGLFNGIRSIDHPVLAVRDLEASRLTCERLGFIVPPRGSHVEWGTGNLCIMFPDDYLELRGIIDPDRFTMNLDVHLDEYGEGLMGVAFGTEDAERSLEEMRRHGVTVGPVRWLTRNFEHPEGWTQPSFAICVPEPEDIEGLMHVVVLEHLTPELIRRPEFLAHQNGCIGVNDISGIIYETSPVAEKMTSLLGEGAVTTAEGGVRLTLPTRQRIDLLLPDGYRERFGEPGPLANLAVSRLGAMTLRVENLDRTRDVLTENRVDFTEPAAGVVRVPPHLACGAMLEFTEAEAG